MRRLLCTIRAALRASTQVSRLLDSPTIGVGIAGHFGDVCSLRTNPSEAVDRSRSLGSTDLRVVQIESAPDGQWMQNVDCPADIQRFSQPGRARCARVDLETVRHVDGAE